MIKSIRSCLQDFVAERGQDVNHGVSSCFDSSFGSPCLLDFCVSFCTVFTVYVST